MAFLFHTKLIPELNVTVFLWQFWKKIDPESDLCPLNIQLSAYNNSKIPLLGKCSLTLKHKKDHFDVYFIVVDSKCVPILGLTKSKPDKTYFYRKRKRWTIFAWVFWLFWTNRNSVVLYVRSSRQYFFL